MYDRRRHPTASLSLSCLHLPVSSYGVFKRLNKHCKVNLVFLFYLKDLHQLEYIAELERERLRTRFWLPTISFHNFFRWSIWDANVILEREDDENPSSFRTITQLFQNY